tara:strand:- start:190 stop:450 length:261 start_codon:yes stop_codon:yes gene_type:complete
MANEKQNQAVPAKAVNPAAQNEREMISILKKIESHLKMLAYYANPSRGMEAGIESDIASTVSGLEEQKDNILQKIIRQEMKNVLGE